jgi:hypothetical protein
MLRVDNSTLPLHAQSPSTGSFEELGVQQVVRAWQKPLNRFVAEIGDVAYWLRLLKNSAFSKTEQY